MKLSQSAAALLLLFVPLQAFTPVSFTKKHSTLLKAKPAPSDDSYASVFAALEKKLATDGDSAPLNIDTPPPQVSEPIVNKNAFSNVFAKTSPKVDAVKTPPSPPPAEVATESVVSTKQAVVSAVTESPPAEKAPSLFDFASQKAAEFKSSVPPPETVVPAKQTAVEAVTAAATTTPDASSAAASSIDKAPTLFEYITRSAEKVATSELETVAKFDAVSNARTKLEIMKQNAIGLTGLSKVPSVDTKATLNALSENTKALSASAAASTATVKGAATKVTAAVAGATAGANAGLSFPDPSQVATFDVSSFNVNDLVDGLKLKEYGSWYVAAAAIVYATVQRQAGKEDARLEFVKELEKAEEKAKEAEEAALLAAQGAMEAKRLADAAIDGKVDVKPDSLEATRLRQLEVDQELMKKELTKLASENSRLLKQLAAATLPTSPTSKTEVAAPTKKAPPVITVMERDPDEDRRVLDLIKEVDQENKAKATATASATEEKTPTKKTKAKSKAKAQKSKASAKVETEEETVAAKSEPAAPAPAKKSKVKGADRVAAAVEELAPKATAKKSAKKNAAKKSSAKKSAKKAKKSLAVDEEPFFASPAAGIDNPWSSLSDSTLKRKTIAQLSEYLTERGAQVVDENGKSLTKASLVENVRSL